jgi:hypothetical protein
MWPPADPGATTGLRTTTFLRRRVSANHRSPQHRAGECAGSEDRVVAQPGARRSNFREPQVSRYSSDDQDLILAADGELPTRRVERLRKHLADCWACRVGAQELKEPSVKKRMLNTAVRERSGGGSALSLDLSSRSRVPFFLWLLIGATPVKNDMSSK